MKFEYTENTRSDNDVVAYIDADGDLVVRDEYGDAICIMETLISTEVDFHPDSATKKFYKGDKVTITF